MTFMTLVDYKRIMTTLITTLAAALLLSIGSVVANHYNTKFQNQDTRRILLEHIERVEEDGLATEEYVDNNYSNHKELTELKESEQNRRIVLLEEQAIKMLELLHKIDKKIPD